MARHRFVIHGKQYEVDIGNRVGSTLQVTVNGRPYVVGLVATPASAAAPAPVAAAAPPPTSAAPSPPASPAAAPPPARSATPRPTTPVGDVPGEVRAPIPGVVLSVGVQVGDAVAGNTKLCVLEAMKMENEIFAGVDGTVKEIHVGAQQEVRQGDLLISITPA
jgi:glutaconyl-CoA decarboxylase